MAAAEGDTTHHGLSAFGDLGYPADFKHVKYVNPTAPKGGTFSQLAGGGTATFNSFNGFILKGDAAVDMEQCFAALMWRAADEPDAVYGYAADKVAVSADGLTYKFHLRDGITFHDGSKITADDVAWSLTNLKEKGHPAIGNLLRDMDSAAAEGDRDVVVKFKPNRARSAPLTVANLPILSKAYYAKQACDETSMDPPVGSGPYKIGKFEQGRFVEFERVKDWWGENLPISGRTRTTSTCCTMTTIATATRPSKASPRTVTRSARSSPHASGRPAMTSLPSRTGASRRSRSPTSVPPVCRPG